MYFVPCLSYVRNRARILTRVWAGRPHVRITDFSHFLTVQARLVICPVFIRRSALGVKEAGP